MLLIAEYNSVAGMYHTQCPFDIFSDSDLFKMHSFYFFEICFLSKAYCNLKKNF